VRFKELGYLPPVALHAHLPFTPLSPPPPCRPPSAHPFARLCCSRPSSSDHASTTHESGTCSNHCRAPNPHPNPHPTPPFSLALRPPNRIFRFTTAEFVKAQTCQGSDLSAFGVVDASKATGLLRTVLDTRTLRVGALGPYDWGGNDGNYKVMPYTGFYPAYLNAFCEMFNTMKVRCAVCVWCVWVWVKEGERGWEREGERVCCLQGTRVRGGRGGASYVSILSVFIQLIMQLAPSLPPPPPCLPLLSV
jgi:hypothetical protein